MRPFASFRFYFAALALVVGLAPSTSAQLTSNPPGSPPPLGGPAIPNITQGQARALIQMDTELQPLAQNVTLARTTLLAASLLTPRNQPAIDSASRALAASEIALARARADAFARIQGTSSRLLPNQVQAFATMGATTAPPAGGGARGRVSIPDITTEQQAILQGWAMRLRSPAQAQADGASALASASLSGRPADIQAAADALGKAEVALASVRADAFVELQSSDSRLTPGQVSALTAVGGMLPAPRGGNNNGPGPLRPLNFQDHENYVSLFDGKTLDGWDGNPKFWRAENGEIIGESTDLNPSGNTYIVYRREKAHDFTLKLEIKIDNAGGSGIQYRSQTGLPWLATVPLAVIANTGPTNLNWMMTGPQADFWPATDPASRITGEFYSENDPMRIMASRANVVEGFGIGPKRLMGTIADPATLYGFVKPTGWNEYTIIARGGTFIHIINGQLMSVMVDDDPKSLNNESGYFGIEIEANSKVHVRNIWLKKLD